MNNGKQSEQLLKVLGGHSASLDRTSKCRGLSEQPLYSGGHKAMQHETRNWNYFDKCEPEQQYRLGTVSYKITGEHFFNLLTATKLSSCLVEHSMVPSGYIA